MSVRIAVLGATGRSGRPLIALALQRGHHVAALARRPKHLARHTFLDVVEGDLLDPAAVAKVVGGADAVIDVSGPSRTSPADLRQRTARILVDTMKQHSVRRVIGVTGAGVRSPDDRPKPSDRVIRGALALLQRSLLEDAEQYVAILRESGLDWTVVRVPRLVDRPAQGDYRVSPGVGPDSGTLLARQDLAQFLLDEAEQPRHSGGMPIVSW